MPPTEFADECEFAKVVSTKSGDALLIAGGVYTVEGPNGNAADLFARALRSMTKRDVIGTLDGSGNMTLVGRTPRAAE